MQPSAKVVKAPAKKEETSSEEESDDDDDDSDEEQAVNLNCWLVSSVRSKFYIRIVVQMVVSLVVCIFPRYEVESEWKCIMKCLYQYMQTLLDYIVPTLM